MIPKNGTKIASPLQLVRAGFVAQGTSLTAWCRTNAVPLSSASLALKFKRDGVKSRELRQRLAHASGVPSREVMSDAERAYFAAARV